MLPPAQEPTPLKQTFMAPKPCVPASTVPIVPPVPATPTMTPTQRLAEALLGQSLDQWVGARRARGLSWKSIAADLAVTTDGAVDVNRETLRVWFREPDEEEEAL